MPKNVVMLVLPLLAAVMIVSGCISPVGSGASGPGLVVSEWKPDFSQVHSGDRVRLQLKIQNQGETRAENVRAELTGIDTTEWGYGFTQTKEIGSLIGFDSVTNTPGATKTDTWELIAPDLAKGLDRTYEPIIKTSYDYTTSATKMITLVDEAELRRIIQQGKTLPGKPTQHSSGPLNVEIKTGDYVKTTDQFGTNYNIFPLYVKITNAQWGMGGTLVTKGYGLEDYPVEVTITPPSGTSFIHTGYGSDCGTSVTVDLWQGEEAEITCELEVTTPPTFREDRAVTVDLDYRFQTEATTQISVVGTGTSSTF